MSEKNFVSYGDSEALLSEVGAALSKRATTFIGSEQEWNALSDANKAKYSVVMIDDDYVEDAPDGIVKGYYNTTDGKFYKESAYTTEWAAATGYLYLELSTFRVYMYDSAHTAYVDISRDVIVSDTTSVSGVQCYKNGVNKQITFSACTDASIPSGYRPDAAKYLGLAFDDETKAPVLIYAATDGSITVQEMTTANVLSTYSLYGTLTYMN